MSGSCFSFRRRARTADPKAYRFRADGMKQEQSTVAPPLAAPDGDVIVNEILAAVRESAKTGRTVILKR